MKITVLYNLPEKNSKDELDTQKSAFGVAEGLKKNYEVGVLGITFNEIENIKNLKTDFVFNLVEWAGKNSMKGVRVIEELEKARLPYSGSNARGYELSCNKEIMKREMEKNNISTPGWQIFEKIQDSGGANASRARFKIQEFSYPVILKPVSEHCGIGIGQDSVCNNNQETRNKVQAMIKKYNQPVLAEEFIDGRELQVTILDKDGKPWVLPPAEVVFAKKEGWKPILSYEGKWDEKSDEYKLSRMELAKLDRNQELGIRNIARKCYLKLGGRDYPRIDIRLRGDEVFVLEINNNPGIDYDIESGIGVSARAVDLSWEGLLKHIVENAYRRKR
ncbi:MAG: D-alanine-D-alanine ligase [Microgenomates group bacterium Gr01-1014_16]|nr:MAG: D-alanine-D-alanine ligase [Microgenomates group bacterium Gr01-1014_16]